jgi:hypothetical protein
MTETVTGLSWYIKLNISTQNYYIRVIIVRISMRQIINMRQ